MIKALKIAAIIVVILTAALLGVQWWLGGKIRRVIEEQGSTVAGGIYTITADRARVNLLNRSVSLRNIRIEGDTAISSGKVPPLIINLSAGRIRAAGLDLKSLKDPSQIALRTLVLSSPQIIIDSYGSNTRDTLPDVIHPDSISEVTTVPPINPGKLSISNLVIRDATVLLRHHIDNDIASYELDGLQISAKDLSTDSTTANNRSRHWFDRAELSAQRFRYTSFDGSRVTTVDSIFYSTSRDIFTVGSLLADPQYEMTEFAYKNRDHVDWTRTSANGISIHGIDLQALAREKTLRIDSLAIANAEMESYKDRNAPQQGNRKVMFHETIQRLPLKADVRTAHLGDITAIYHELPQFETTAGVIKFTGLTGDLHGLSNIASEAEPFYTLKAKGMLYGSAELQATFYLPKDSLTNRFEVIGSLAAMDATRLNEMIVPVANARVNSGHIDNMTFHITGTNTHSSVEMTLLYHDLNIDLLKHKNNELESRKFLSWIVNNVVVSSENPGRRGTRTGSGTTERNFYRSQWNYLWRSLMPGIKGSVGLKN